MTAFRLNIIKKGFEGKEIEYAASLDYSWVGTKIDFEDELILPETFQGYPLVYIGYQQDYTPEHVRDHDWHHPSQGSDGYYPKEYYPKAHNYPADFPKNLKKIFIPKTVRYICEEFFKDASTKYCPNLVIEVDPENPYLKVVDNKVVRK